MKTEKRLGLRPSDENRKAFGVAAFRRTGLVIQTRRLEAGLKTTPNGFRREIAFAFSTWFEQYLQKFSVGCVVGGRLFCGGGDNYIPCRARARGLRSGRSR